MARKAADNTIARVTDIISTSNKGFDDAIHSGVNRACKTQCDVRGAWVTAMKVNVENGKIARYRIDMLVTFVVHETV